jgi:hypothetical protein
MLQHAISANHYKRVPPNGGQKDRIGNNSRIELNLTLATQFATGVYIPLKWAPFI